MRTRMSKIDQQETAVLVVRRAQQLVSALQQWESSLAGQQTILMSGKSSRDGRRRGRSPSGGCDDDLPSPRPRLRKRDTARLDTDAVELRSQGADRVVVHLRPEAAPLPSEHQGAREIGDRPPNNVILEAELKLASIRGCGIVHRLRHASEKRNPSR